LATDAPGVSGFSVVQSPAQVVGDDGTTVLSIVVMCPAFNAAWSITVPEYVTVTVAPAGNAFAVPVSVGEL
jgi:hypothetical protein